MARHYEAFELMILSTTLLGNDNGEKWKEDATKILDFIGNAYGFSAEMLTKTKQNILEATVRVQTKEDADITLITELDDFEVTQFEFLKGKTVNFLQSFFNRDELYFTDYRYPNPYYPELHFYNTQTLARTGNLLTVRHLGLLYHLGIGKEKNSRRAEKLLWNAAFWGDESSLYLLKEIAKSNNDQKSQNNLAQLIMLTEEHLYTGTTQISESAQYNVWAQENYKLISSIFHDVVLANSGHSLIKENINLSFVEVMRLPNLTYTQKMKYVNEYQLGKWKNETNKIILTEPGIGFVKGAKK